MPTILIDKNVMLLLRDGVRLATDVYRLDGAAPAPVSLRTPYNNKRTVAGSGTFDSLRAVQVDYIVVVQDMPGRFASEVRSTPSSMRAATAPTRSSGRLFSHGRVSDAGTRLHSTRISMDTVQERVQALIDHFIARDHERGLQVAAYYHEQQIVDAWGGLADAATGRPVDGDTLFTVWSVSKGITATAIHVLADRGIVAYDTPVATYWPEFAVNGKHTITVRQIMAHTAGLPHMPDGTTAEDTCDWALMTSRIAQLTPAWEPGTAMGYHALTYGWLVGEVGRRSDGRPFAQIVQDELCRPLGIDSLFLGIPDDVEPRVARLELTSPAGDELAPEEEGPALDSLALRSLGPLATTSGPDWANRPDVRRASIPGAGGIMNARAVARVYAALAAGEIDGVRLLTRERIKQASALQYVGPDVMGGGLHHKALGYHLGETGSTMSERQSCFGHAGAGGSYGFADPDYGLSFGICKTRMVNATPGADAATVIARAIRESLGIPEA